MPDTFPLLRSAASFVLRDDGSGAMPVLSINFARFNEWTEINSIFEGHFMERFAPGSFTKTFAERGGKIRALFQHGQDPSVGSKPIGSITDLREEDDGAWADVQLLDADYVRELVPGLRAGLYGASMAFRPIPEVTVRESAVREFGPVTFPAYENTSAGVRSLTDDLVIERLMAHDPDRLRELLAERAPAAETSENDEPGTPDTASTSPDIHVVRMQHDLLGRRWQHLRA